MIILCKYLQNLNNRSALGSKKLYVLFIFGFDESGKFKNGNRLIHSLSM